MDLNAKELHRLVATALGQSRARDANGLARDVLAALADWTFEGASSAEVREDLRLLRSEGLGAPGDLIGGLLAFGDRRRDRAPMRDDPRQHRYADDPEDDDPEDDDPEAYAEDDEPEDDDPEDDDPEAYAEDDEDELEPAGAPPARRVRW